MTTRMNRLLAIGLIFATSNVMAGSLIFGAGRSEKQKPQSASKTETAAPLFQTQRTDEKQYPAEELEQLRSKLLELVDTVKEYSDLLLPDNPELTGKLEAARKQFEQYSPQQLNAARAALNPAEMNARFGEARAALEEYRPALESVRQQRRQQSKLRQSTGVQINSTGLPGRDSPDSVCDALVGSGRVTYAMNTAADVIFIAASVVKEVASRGCNQVGVVVVAGEGGGANTSLACVATDAVFFVAQAVRNKLTACDVDYTERTVDASFSRLEHIHTDLENSVANDNTNTTTITTAISNSQTAVVNNANSNTSTITTAIANVQTAIINNATANKNELRDLMLRTQIEADLASTDGSTFVALYLTPGAKGGYLELVRTIVVQTIANIGGANTAQANAFLAKGDVYKAAGDYRSAYSSYRQAYKKAQGL
jgi:tetratricopeptide (TPR) repeat protein